MILSRVWAAIFHRIGEYIYCDFSAIIFLCRNDIFFIAFTTANISAYLVHNNYNYV